MSIATDSIVSIYSDTMAYVMMLGLIVIASQYRVGKDEYENRIFFRIAILTSINALSNGISYALHHQQTGWAHPVRMIMPTIAELSTLVLLFGWMIYVDYRLYESKERTHWHMMVFKMPVYLFMVLCVINIFTGFMFEVNESHEFIAKPAFYFMSLCQYLYGIMPIVMVIHYNKNHGKKHFFSLYPVVVPVVTASLLTLLTGYSARSLGFSIAVVFLYFSHVNRWRFDDIESGFFNRAYANYVMDLSGENRMDYHSVITFKVQNAPKAFFEILRNEIPKDAEIIRLSKYKFVLFSESANASMINLLSSMIQDEADEYDEANPNEPIDLDITYRIRMRKESAVDFVKNMSRT